MTTAGREDTRRKGGHTVQDWNHVLTHTRQVSKQSDSEGRMFAGDAIIHFHFAVDLQSSSSSTVRMEAEKKTRTTEQDGGGDGR